MKNQIVLAIDDTDFGGNDYGDDDYEFDDDDEDDDVDDEDDDDDDEMVTQLMLSKRELGWKPRGRHMDWAWIKSGGISKR